MIILVQIFIMMILYHLTCKTFSTNFILAFIIISDLYLTLLENELIRAIIKLLSEQLMRIIESLLKMA